MTFYYVTWEEKKYNSCIEYIRAIPGAASATFAASSTLSRPNAGASELRTCSA